MGSDRSGGRTAGERVLLTRSSGRRAALGAIVSAFAPRPLGKREHKPIGADRQTRRARNRVVMQWHGWANSARARPHVPVVSLSDAPGRKSGGGAKKQSAEPVNAYAGRLLLSSPCSIPPSPGGVGVGGRVARDLAEVKCTGVHLYEFARQLNRPLANRPAIRWPALELPGNFSICQSCQ